MMDDDDDRATQVASDQRSRHVASTLPCIQVIFAAAAVIALLALFHAAQLSAAETAVASGSVRLLDQAADPPALANGHPAPAEPPDPRC